MSSSPTSGTAAASGEATPSAVDEPTAPAPVSGFEGDASEPNARIQRSLGDFIGGARS